MKWDRKALVRGARAAGWKGTTLKELKDWQNGPDGCDFVDADDNLVDVDEAWGTKAKQVVGKATLTLDAGENLNELNVVGADDGEPDPDEQMADDMEDDEDEVKTRRKSLRQRQNEAMARGHRRVNGEIHDERRESQRSRKSSLTPEMIKNISDRKRYNKAAAGGQKVLVPGCGYRKTSFDDADVAEAFVAHLRLGGMGYKGYAQKARDLEIVQKSTMVEYDATLGGNWVVNEVDTALIDLKNEFGVFRRACGVETMNSKTKTVFRTGSDPAVGDVGEGQSLPESNATTDAVELTATKSGVLIKASSEVLEDSAISVADYLSTSTARAAARYEDHLGFNSSLTVSGTTYTREGISSKVGSNSTHDAALSTPAWSEYVLGDIATWNSLLAPKAYQNGNVAYFGSLSFFHQVLMRFARAGGGNTGRMLLEGHGQNFNGAELEFDGVPYYITNVLPQSVSADQKTAYFGALDAGCKFGERAGSKFEMADQRYFDQDLVAFRYLWRWAINCHDVNNTQDDDSINNSMVVALQD